MIYLASPYSHKSKSVEATRAHEVMKAVGQLTKLKQLVYSPIAHWHHIAKICSMGTTHEDHIRHNEEMMDRCERFIILQLDGWRTSNGIAKESRYYKLYHGIIEGIDPQRLVKGFFEPNIIGDWIWNDSSQT